MKREDISKHRKEEESMSKVYSTVDAHEAEKFVIQEGYFGDTLEQIVNKSYKGTLEWISDSAHISRFKFMGGGSFNLFQPIEKTDLEKAKELLGKKLISNVCGDVVIFTELQIMTDDRVMLKCLTRNYLLEDVLACFRVCEN